MFVFLSIGNKKMFLHTTSTPIKVVAVVHLRSLEHHSSSEGCNLISPPDVNNLALHLLQRVISCDITISWEDVRSERITRETGIILCLLALVLYSLCFTNQTSEETFSSS